MFSFEKNSKGTNPPGPLSFITLDSKTEEELPLRLVSILQTAEFNFLLMIQGLFSAGLISEGVGITLGALSTSMDHQGNPGSLRGSGIGQKKTALTSGATSSLPGVLQGKGAKIETYFILVRLSPPPLPLAIRRSLRSCRKSVPERHQNSDALQDP